MLDTLTTDLMPADTSLNTLLVRVMVDHGITQRTLAASLDLDRSHVTRMCNATSAVTLDAVRALYRITRDPRLVQAVAESGDTVLLDLAGHDMGRPDIDACSLVVALSRVQSTAVTRMRTPDCPRTLAEIDDALLALLRARKHVARGHPLPYEYRAAKPLPVPA